MQLIYILAALSTLVSIVPGILAVGDAQAGRGIRHHHGYAHRYSKYGGNDYYYGRENDYGYEGDDYGKDLYYDGNRHSRRHGHDGYYRYRRNEESAVKANTPENTEQVLQVESADEAEGHRRRHHHRHHHHHHRRSSRGRRSSHRHRNHYYDNDYGYGRGSGYNRGYNYYYY